MTGAIDVHAHYLPDFYRQALSDNGHQQPDGYPFTPEFGMAASFERLSADGDLMGALRSNSERRFAGLI